MNAELRLSFLVPGLSPARKPEKDEGRRMIVSPLGLYIHVPFCRAICNYCNFNRGLLDEMLKARYVRAVEREIAGAGESDPMPADTIYFGGGTPSLVEPDEIGGLIDRCRTSFDVRPGAEITLEVNPETVTTDRLRRYREAGVNRLSLGVQSLRDAELQRLGRLHTADRARSAYHLSRAAGFENVSVDLMMWLPQQSVAQWLESVDAVIALGPDHVSLYLLELYPNAPLRDEMVRAGWSQAPDEDAAEMYTSALERLEVAGYEQYEISNVARPGRQSRHNLKYWSDGEWLGFGCGAHSTRSGVRRRNVSATEEYVARIEAGREVVAERRVLSMGERLEDALFMGLRTASGIDLGSIGRRYGVDVWQRYGGALAPFIDAGLLHQESGHLRLTRQGMLLANEVMSVFV